MANRLVVAVVALLAVISALLLGQSKPSIQGVWRVAEVTTSGPNASTNKSPQPGLYIFTGKHYSLVRDASPNPRIAIKDSGNVTAPEALATFGPFIAQSGTYDVRGTTVNVTPVVAKFPASREKYGTSTWSFKLQGDTLSMTYLIGRNATTVRLTRVE